MKRPALVFWGSAAGVALGLAALAAAFLPYEALRIHTVAERERAWLLTVWTAGVMAILFGLTALLGGFSWIGFRDVVEAGSVKDAAEQHRKALRKRERVEFHRSFDWWLISTGALLVGVYFVGWLALTR